MFAALVALTLANAPTAEAPPKLVSGPITMKMSEVRAYNRTLARDHPNYNRCKRIDEIGSLVKKRTDCRTNQEWARVENLSNQEAREAVEGLQKGWSNGN